MEMAGMQQAEEFQSVPVRLKQERPAAVLVIDDHPAVRHGITQLIDGTDDMRVCCDAGGIIEARECLRNTIPDSAIIDISLGDAVCSGLDFITELHALFGPIPILVYSMHNETVFAYRAFQTGARGYLMKKEPVCEILNALRTILSGNTYLSPAMRERGVPCVKTSCARTKGGRTPDGGKPGKFDAPPRPDDVSSMSPREFEVFRLLGKGMQSAEIAHTLCLSVKTVETHKLKIRRKLCLPDARALTRFAVSWWTSCGL
jgi:two-component system, NarL family, response regulator FusR